MGYKTSYVLTAKGESVDLSMVSAVMLEIDENCAFEPCTPPDGKLYQSEWTWYDWQEDMQKLAARFPGVLFELHGEGEEAGDIWRAYYKHGHEPVIQWARVTFDEPPEWAES